MYLQLSMLIQYLYRFFDRFQFVINRESNLRQFTLHPLDEYLIPESVQLLKYF